MWAVQVVAAAAGEARTNAPRRMLAVATTANDFIGLTSSADRIRFVWRSGEANGPRWPSENHRR